MAVIVEDQLLSVWRRDLAQLGWILIWDRGKLKFSWVWTRADLTRQRESAHATVAVGESLCPLSVGRERVCVCACVRARLWAVVVGGTGGWHW